MKGSKILKARKEKMILSKALKQESVEDEMLMKEKINAAVKKAYEKLTTRVCAIEELFGEYITTLEDKLTHFSKMEGYDMDFQVTQKFSDLWNMIDSEKFAYLRAEDRLNLDNNLRELRNKLAKIEMHQLEQKNFLIFFSEILKHVNRLLKEKEAQDAEAKCNSSKFEDNERFKDIDKANDIDKSKDIDNANDIDKDNDIEKAIAKEVEKYKRKEDYMKKRLKELKEETMMDIKLRQQAFEKELEGYASQVRLRIQIVSNVPFSNARNKYDDDTKNYVIEMQGNLKNLCDELNSIRFEEPSESGLREESIMPCAKKEVYSHKSKYSLISPSMPQIHKTLAPLDNPKKGFNKLFRMKDVLTASNSGKGRSQHLSGFSSIEQSLSKNFQKSCYQSVKEKSFCVSKMMHKTQYPKPILSASSVLQNRQYPVLKIVLAPAAVYPFRHNPDIPFEYNSSMSQHKMLEEITFIQLKFPELYLKLDSTRFNISDIFEKAAKDLGMEKSNDFIFSEWLRIYQSTARHFYFLRQCFISYNLNFLKNNSKLEFNPDSLHLPEIMMMGYEPFKHFCEDIELKDENKIMTIFYLILWADFPQRC